jgi:hypothetical protein
MYTSIDICLAVLGGFWIGACIGLVVGGLNRAAKHATPEPVFHVPAAHRENEHDAAGNPPQQYH